MTHDGRRAARAGGWADATRAHSREPAHRRGIARGDGWSGTGGCPRQSTARRADAVGGDVLLDHDQPSKSSCSSSFSTPSMSTSPSPEHTDTRVTRSQAWFAVINDAVLIERIASFRCTWSTRQAPTQHLQWVIAAHEMCPVQGEPDVRESTLDLPPRLTTVPVSGWKLAVATIRQLASGLSQPRLSPIVVLQSKQRMEWLGPQQTTRSLLASAIVGRGSGPGSARAPRRRCQVCPVRAEPSSDAWSVKGSSREAPASPGHDSRGAQPGTHPSPR